MLAATVDMEMREARWCQAGDRVQSLSAVHSVSGELQRTALNDCTHNHRHEYPLRIPRHFISTTLYIPWEYIMILREALWLQMRKRILGQQQCPHANG